MFGEAWRQSCVTVLGKDDAKSAALEDHARRTGRSLILHRMTSVINNHITLLTYQGFPCWFTVG